MRKPLIAVLAALGLQACVIDTRAKDTLIEPTRTIDVAVNPGTPIAIRFPAGDVEIVRSTDAAIHAELDVYCPETTGRCANKLADLDFETRAFDGGLELRLNRNRAMGMRHGRIVARIAVPEGHPLDVDITAGDVDVDVANCLRVDMEAGDLTVRVPSAMVRSVDLDTGVGDASLVVDGRRISERRSFLIGAEVHWRAGVGDCAIVVDLQAGDARVDLG